MYIFAMPLTRVKAMQQDEAIRRLSAEMSRAPEFARKLLERQDEMQFLASEFADCEEMVFIGRGIDYALSLEASYKMSEVGCVRSSAYAAGELAHGPIANVASGTPVVALATQIDLFDKTIADAREAKARGARVALFCREDAPAPQDSCDYIYTLPHFEGALMPLLLAAPMQLLAYYMGVQRGCDIDK
jgi:glucosamine--fructose-6-phosphate aminotransferase (isomerizing)